jgi:hypothetical protein
MFCSVPLLTNWIVPYEKARKMAMLDNTRAVQWEAYPGPDGFALEVNALTDSDNYIDLTNHTIQLCIKR